MQHNPRICMGLAAQNLDEAAQRRLQQTVLERTLRRRADSGDEHMPVNSAWLFCVLQQSSRSPHAGRLAECKSRFSLRGGWTRPGRKWLPRRRPKATKSSVIVASGDVQLGSPMCRSCGFHSPTQFSRRSSAARPLQTSCGRGCLRLQRTGLASRVL